MNDFTITFLGTGAADWEYHPTKAMRFDVSKQIRRTSSIWLNGHILIDPAPEAYFFAKHTLNLELSELTDIFLTHSHEDHFDRKALADFVSEAKSRVRFYCHESTARYLMLDQELTKKLEIVLLQVMTPVVLGEYEVIPLAANHEVIETQETVLHYVFNYRGKGLLYGCDGGWFLAATWSYLLGRELAAVILDTTVGESVEDFRIASHNSLPMIRILLAAMRKNRVLKRDGIALLSHFARTLHDPIIETERRLQQEGLLCAYDGLTIKL